jgi:hypothetical protein
MSDSEPEIDVAVNCESDHRTPVLSRHARPPSVSEADLNAAFCKPARFANTESEDELEAAFSEPEYGTCNNCIGIDDDGEDQLCGLPCNPAEQWCSSCVNSLGGWIR